MSKERSLEMTAQYWTITGHDMWRMDKREVFDFKNLQTDEIVTIRTVTEVKEKGLLPVTMPQIKPRTPKVKKKKIKTMKSTKSSRRGPRSLSNYKGVSPSKTKGKFRVQFYDKKKKTNIGLGTFPSELLAAEAYQEHIGNHKEAKRLRNEYQEGNGQPEISEPNVVHKKMFKEDKPNPALQPSEI